KGLRESSQTRPGKSAGASQGQYCQNARHLAVSGAKAGEKCRWCLKTTAALKDFAVISRLAFSPPPSRRREKPRRLFGLLTTKEDVAARASRPHQRNKTQEMCIRSQNCDHSATAVMP